MPAINQEFNVQVKDSALDRYVQKTEKAVAATDQQIGAMDKLTKASEKMSQSSALKASPAVDTWLKSGQKWNDYFGTPQKTESTGDSEAQSKGRIRSWIQEELAANKAYYAERKAAREQAKLSGETQKTEGWAKRAARAFLSFGKAQNPVKGLANRLSRTVVMLFSVRRVMRYISDAIERAPDKVGSSFTKMGNTVNDSFSRVVANAMSGMQGGIDKLNAAMNSKAGQRFFRGLDTAAQLAGKAIGFLLEDGAKLIEFLGNHAAEAFTVAGIAVAFFAAKMLVSHAATIAAAAPIVLVIGLLSALVVGLMKSGVTAEEVFTGIGRGAGFLYALVYNIIADLYNVCASFAEYVANFMDAPFRGIARLAADLADVILSMIESIGGAIGKLLGKDWSSGIRGFRNELQSWVDGAFGEKKITVSRMDKLDYTDTMNRFGTAFGDFGSKLSSASLDSMSVIQLKAIKGDTSSLKKSVDSTKEDLKSLVDIAERRYINQVNLTTQQPIITINGANTGSTQEDREALANAIKEVLIMQTSSGAVVATAMPY